MHFKFFRLVQSSYLAGTRVHQVPTSTAQEVTRIYMYLHLTGLNKSEYHGAKLLFKRYQSGSIHRSDWQIIPNNIFFFFGGGGGEAGPEIVTRSYDMSDFVEMM